MRQILKGSSDQSVVIRIVDSTDGTPETGVTSATSGLDLKYRREGGTVASLTESDLAAVDSAHSDGGMIHIGAGYYRIDLPDAAVATGANGVLVFGTVTGMVVIGCYVPLVDYNPYDGVRLGLTALPNAAAEASGGLITRGSGTGQLNVSGGKAPATLAAADVSGNLPADVTAISGDSTAADNLESYTDGTTPMPVNATQVSGSATAADNVEVVFATDFATAYSTSLDRWATNVVLIEGADATDTIVSLIDARLAAYGVSTYSGADTAGTTTLLSRLSATRAGHLDNLSGGAVALEATAQAILTDTAEIGPAGAGLTDLGGFSQAALAQFFLDDTGETYGDAVAGSVVKEIADNAGGSSLTETGIAETVTEYMFTHNAGSYGTAHTNSVVKQTADNAGGSSLTAEAIADEVETRTIAAVAEVSGDVGGKVLGGGSGTITGTGVRAVDGSGNAIAPASTALSTAVWTNTRAGYLDKLNVSGTLAHTDNASTFRADVSGLLTTAGFAAALPANFGDLAITETTGRVTVGTNADKTGYSVSGTLTTLDALNASLSSAHGAGSWATATGFSTHSASDVWSADTRTLTAGTNIQLPDNGLANITAWTVAITGNITGNLSGSVGSLATQAKADVNAEVDAALSDVGLTTAITGRIDATISSRLAAASYTAPDNASIALILEDTGTTLPGTLGVIAAYIDTEVAAIKTKTDQLTFTVAGKVDATADVDVDEEAIAEAVAAELGDVLDPLASVVPGDYPDGTAGAVLGALATSEVTFVSPLSEDGDEMEVIRGDSYLADDARSFNWSSTSWRDLTDATVVWTSHGTGAPPVEMTVTAAGEGTQSVRLELQALLTGTLQAGAYEFEVVAELATGGTVTLRRGTLIVKGE